MLRIVGHMLGLTFFPLAMWLVICLDVIPPGFTRFDFKVDIYDESWSTHGGDGPDARRFVKDEYIVCIPDVLTSIP